MNLDWLQVCAEGQTDGCVAPIQLAYLVALIVGAILLAVLARRQRDLSTAVLALMPVAIAINIAVGSLTIALRLPIYLDSIGTVLVGALAGPWAGALTGLLSNLIWSILPVPGGAGPTTAFYAPVAAVIGLMAGWWTHRGAFRLRSDDARVGSFLAVAAGIAAAGIAFLIVQSTIGLPELFPEDQAAALDNQMRFVLIALAIIAIAVVVGWVTRRTVFAFRGDDARIRPYLAVATGLSAAALVFAILRLLFAPGGYFSAKDGVLDALTSLAIADPGSLILALSGRRRRRARVALGVGGRPCPAVPRLGRRAHDRLRRGRDVGTDQRRRLRRCHRLRHRRARGVVPDARPERVPVGLRPGPHVRPAGQDAELHHRLRHPRRPADHRPHDVQPRRGHRRGRGLGTPGLRVDDHPGILPPGTQLAAPAPSGDEAARAVADHRGGVPAAGVGPAGPRAAVPPRGVVRRPCG